MDSMLEDVVLSALLKFDGYPDAMALPRDQRQRYQERAKAVAAAVENKFIVGRGLWQGLVEPSR